MTIRKDKIPRLLATVAPATSCFRDFADALIGITQIDGQSRALYYRDIIIEIMLGEGLTRDEAEMAIAKLHPIAGETTPLICTIWRLPGWKKRRQNLK